MTFKENVDQGIGTLLINSSFLSRSKKNPLGKLWELGIRKRFLKEYGGSIPMLTVTPTGNPTAIARLDMISSIMKIHMRVLMS